MCQSWSISMACGNHTLGHGRDKDTRRSLLVTFAMLSAARRTAFVMSATVWQGLSVGNRPERDLLRVFSGNIGSTNQERQLQLYDGYMLLDRRSQSHGWQEIDQAHTLGRSGKVIGTSIRKRGESD